jgi:predicted nuclease of restriction endonuclease-like (RecB) superfamily
MADNTPSTQTYPALLASIKERIQSAQLRAAVSVNRELVVLYWGIGKEILDRQEDQGWGTKVIENLARDLKRSFPDMEGFSVRNLKYMRAFADAWRDEQLVQQLVAQLPWGHNLRLLDKVSSPEERAWYASQTIQNGWSRNVLVMQIEGGLYRRQGSLPPG